MKGRKPKAPHLRLLEGTRGQYIGQRNQPKPAGDLFAPPADLPKGAVPIWNETIASAPKGLLKKLDKRAVALWSVTAWAFIRQAQLYDETGEDLAVKNLARLASTTLRIGIELGFTPSSRTRINLVKESPGDSEFDEFA